MTSLALPFTMEIIGLANKIVVKKYVLGKFDNLTIKLTKSSALATVGTSYPPLTLSGPTGTAADSKSLGFPLSSASYSNACLSSVSRLEKLSLSELLGYSQSMSSPSKLFSRKNSTALNTKVWRLNRLFATSLNLAVPNDQPPIANKTLSLGFLPLSPTTRS